MMDLDTFYELYIVAPLLIFPILADLLAGLLRGGRDMGGHRPPWPSLTSARKRQAAAQAMYGVWARAPGSLGAPCAPWGRPPLYPVTT